MFRYINTAKLVATYLREFSFKSTSSGSIVPTMLYKFVLCLCLPFVSPTFRRARLVALAIAGCTNSADQIRRVINKTTGAVVSFTEFGDNFFMSYDGTNDPPLFPYSGLSDPLVPYAAYTNRVVADIELNNADRNEVEAYLKLLVPFYVELTINYI